MDVGPLLGRRRAGRTARPPPGRSPAGRASTRRSGCPRSRAPAASARSSTSSRSVPHRATTASARASGLNSRNRRGFAMPPTMTARRDAGLLERMDDAPRAGPACTQVIASTTPLERLVGLADVRHRDDPDAARRAVSAKSTGKRPLPAMRPMRSIAAHRQTPRCEPAMKASSRSTSGTSPSSARTCADVLAPAAAAVEEQAVGAPQRADGRRPRSRGAGARPRSGRRAAPGRPATVQNGGTSFDTIAPAAHSADSPRRTNWCTPASPPTMAWLSTVTWPAERDAVGEDDGVARGGSRARRARTP